MKSFGQKPWMLPQPVLIIGTYDKNGKPNAMNAAWGGQWDAKEIMIAMGAHATTENLNRCIRNFMANDLTATFDRIYPQLCQSRALIIDLRNNVLTL